jgi:hypothetical protein
MNNDNAIINRQGMILSNFMKNRYGCNRRIGDLTLGDNIEICEFLNGLEKSKLEEVITEKVRAFISKNMEKFYDVDERNLQELLHLVGYIKRVNEKVYHCIFQKIFEHEITNNRDEMQILVDKKLLIRRINGDFYHSNDFCKVYIIESDKL